MRFIPFLVLLSVGLFACGPDVQVVVVTVEDMNGRPLDSARVTLMSQETGSSTFTEVNDFATDEEGEVSFTYSVVDNHTYKVIAERAFYEAIVNEGGDSYANEQVLAGGDSAIVTLALDLIEAPDPVFLNKIHQEVSVDEVLGVLKANQWDYAILPRLTWEDVPTLIEAGGDSTVISNYPLHPTSTYKPTKARVGLVALWLVEAIRKMEMKGSEDLLKIVPPSRAPVLGTRIGNPSGHNTADQIQRAQAAYQAWYEAVEAAPNSRRINELRNIPLRNEGMSWM